MEFLTSTILSGIAWDVIKEGGKLTAEYLRENLKSWILKDTDYEIISNSINESSAIDTKSIKYLDAYIDSNEAINDVLQNINYNTNYMQDNNVYNNSVNASGNRGTQTITINNLTDAKPKK